MFLPVLLPYNGTDNVGGHTGITGISCENQLPVPTVIISPAIQSVVSHSCEAYKPLVARYRQSFHFTEKNKTQLLTSPRITDTGTGIPMLIKCMHRIINTVYRHNSIIHSTDEQDRTGTVARNTGTRAQRISSRKLRTVSRSLPR